MFGLAIGDSEIGGLIGLSFPRKCCVLGEGRGGDACFFGEYPGEDPWLLDSLAPRAGA